MSIGPRQLSITAFEPSTLVELLRWRAANQPDREAYAFLSGEGEQEATLTYGDLDAEARRIGALLLRSGAEGRRVLLLYPPGLDYVSSFFGCLYAGAVAVPAYPPRLNRNVLRLRGVVVDARAELALATARIHSRVAAQVGAAPELGRLDWLIPETDASVSASDWRPRAAGGDDLAMLQYTSGSTGTPRGVMLSHRNLLHNSSLLAGAFEYGPDSRCVSWLPVYHDMGLIGGILQPLYGGFHCTLLSPSAFLQRPLTWLQTISRRRGTISGAPDFAYDLCVERIRPAEREALDLSSWEVAFNGSEPIRARTLERFAAAFAPCGFRPESFFPCYGLAEATLMVAGGEKSAPPVVKRVSAAGLENNRIAEASFRDDDAVRTLAGCGLTMPGQKVVIADPATLTPCGPGRIGEIWVSGPSVARGYWGRPDETESTFGARLADGGEGPYLRTGDLGFLDGNQLFVTGRLKDLIIIRGLNHYPHDIELTAERCHPALRPHAGAAFSVESGGQERLVIAHEVDGRARTDLDAVAESIRRAVSEGHELQVYEVVLLKPGALPKTSSGKIQRRACKAEYLSGTLTAVWKSRADASPEPETDGPRGERAPDRVEDLEAFLAARLAAEVGVDPSRIDVERPVTQYGLDSLMAVEFAHGLESRLGVVLPMADLLEGPTIRQLAARLRSQSAPAARPVAAAGRVEATEHPLSYGQTALWFLHQLAPGRSDYNVARAGRIRGELDVAALRRSFQTLLDRHAALRTTFAASAAGGGAVQRVNAHQEVDFRQTEAAGWDETRMRERLAEAVARPFDLEHGPLFRVELFTRSARDHVLLIAVHHIAADLWSLAVLMDELGRIYRAELEGRTAALAPLPLQYADFARRQNERLAGPEGEELWGYWRERLSGELPPLNLTTDRPRPSARSFKGARRSFVIDSVLADALKNLARDSGTTLYVCLLAAFQTLLHRYTGQEDILVGTSTTGRGRADLTGLVGYFVNPVVLRADLSGNPTFREFLTQQGRSVREALRHQDYPLSLLVEQLRPARNLDQSPLFQVMCVMERAHLLGDELAPFIMGEGRSKLKMGDFEVEPYGVEQRTSQFDLTLMFAEVGDEISASLEYDTDIFDEATIARMAGHYHVLLAAVAVAGGADERVGEVAVMGGAERRRLLVEWNETGAEYERGRCAHDLIAARARERPWAEAVAGGGERLSYAEMEGRAEALARRLRGLGVGPETLVGVCVERSAGMVVALLAVWKAGGAYVPLDPSYPRERLRYIMEETGVVALLTQSKLLPALPETGAHVICLDDECPPADVAGDDTAAPAPTPDNLAYVIYTSGSSGRPKGVMIPHRGLVNYLSWCTKAYAVGEGRGAPVHSPLGFDLTVTSLFAPLLAGRCAVLLPADAGLEALRGELKAADDPFSLVKLTPSHLEALGQLLAREGGGAGTRALIIGGEALFYGHVEDWRTHAPSTRLINEYGPTETVVGCCVYEITADDPPTGAVPIGRPIANTQAYVLDARLRPVPVGVAGELYVGGDGVARGYLGRPALTAERFIPDAFASSPGGRLYRTGDLARYVEGGELEYLGRADGQVKVRGYRIELGEIEAVLSGHAAVRECAALAREDAPGDKRIVAYVATGPGPAAGAGELREYLRAHLPDYMLPSAFVFLERLPLTANGKVDRRALPEPDRAAPGAAAGFVAPSTPAEEVLAGVWSELLRVERVGIHDNFFELGGHSLLATQVVARARDLFGVELPLQSSFKYQTVAELAAAVEELLVEQIALLSDEEAERSLRGGL